jgi:hypothetical protein
MSKWVLWMQPFSSEAMKVGVLTSTPHCPSSSVSRRAISSSSTVNSAASDGPSEMQGEGRDRGPGGDSPWVRSTRVLSNTSLPEARIFGPDWHVWGRPGRCTCGGIERQGMGQVIRYAEHITYLSWIPVLTHNTIGIPPHNSQTYHDQLDMFIIY